MSKFYTNIRISGDTIFHRYIDTSKSSPHYLVKDTNFQPTLFLTTNKKTGWTNLHGVNVSQKSFNTIRESKDFLKEYTNVSGFQFHGNNDIRSEYMATKYPGEIEYNIDMLKIFFIDIEVRVGDSFPDALVAEQEITAISVYSTQTKKYYVFGSKELIKGPLKDLQGNLMTDVFHTHYRTEKERLSAFLAWWESNYPDIVSGWFTDGFDIPYIVNRISKLFGEEFTKKLSPWSRIDAKNKKDSFGNNDKIKYDIWGIESLDYMELYKKYVPQNQEQYTLDYIATEELGVGKVKFEGSLNDLYDNDYDMFILYNVIDVERVVQLDKKLKMIDLQINQAYRAKINYTDAFSPVKLWTNIIYHALIKDQIVLPPKINFNKEENFTGAYVMEPAIGLHDWVATFDATSLYPSIIMCYNISPETKLPAEDLPAQLDPFFDVNLVQEIINKTDNIQNAYSTIKEHNYSMTASGHFYTRENPGILPTIVSKMFEDRKAAKTKMLDLKKEKRAAGMTEKEIKLDPEISTLSIVEQGLKICLNSLYGAVGNEYFHLFDTDIAESITLSGQAALQYVSSHISKCISKIDNNPKSHVIAGDTDSIFLSLSGVVDMIKKERGNISQEKTVDLISKFADTQVSNFSKIACLELADDMNMFARRLEFKREKIITRMAYTAKKRYACMVADSEGVRYPTPELSCTGLETNRSSTPKIVRDWLETSLEVMLTKDEKELRDFVASVKIKYDKAKIEDISFPRGVNGITKYNARLDSKGNSTDSEDIYKKGCPQHVRASLMYNHLITKNKLSGKYPLIKEGDKIKFIELIEQNPTRENVIAFKTKWPTELGLDSFIDRKGQLQKSYLDPLNSVLDKVALSIENRASIDDFM